MKSVLSINVYYKGLGFDKEATAALRDFIKKNLPRLKKYSLSETGSGFFFSENLRDIGYEIKTDKPVSIKSKRYKQGKFTIHPLLSMQLIHKLPVDEWLPRVKGFDDKIRTINMGDHENEPVLKKPERPIVGGINWGDIEEVRKFAHDIDAYAIAKERELDEELQRRFDGNRISSQEHAEDIHALQAQLTEAKEALDRAHKVFAHEMDERAKEAHESQMYRGLLKSADGYLTDHDENCTLHLAIKARLYGE